MRTQWHIWFLNYCDGTYVPITLIGKTDDELVARRYAVELTRNADSLFFGKPYIVTTVPKKNLIMHYFWKKKFVSRFRGISNERYTSY